MFKLDQHIEFLLLKHDCIVVPDFGGFVVHHIASHLDEADGMMLPPKHVVGFNQQLTLNDSVLVQSYVDAYDLSYPEALKQIETEVEELKSIIGEYGYYDIRSIGRIMLNKHGMYEFEPTEAGITVPALYGLSGVDTTDSVAFLSREEKKMEPLSVYDDEDEDKHFIRISTSTLRNVAVACAVIMIMLCLPALNNNDKAKEVWSSINSNILSHLTVNDVLEKEQPVEHKTYHVYVKKHADTIEKADVAEEKNAEEVAEESVAKTTEPVFTVVLAARISEANAELYAKQLTVSGMTDVRVIGEGKGRKVVCGSFPTEEQAQQKRRELSGQAEFESAWITQIK